jgi:hypothetical protein
MKSKGIVRNAVTSNLPLELSYREPVVSGQAETHHDKLPIYKLHDSELQETRIEFAQLLTCNGRRFR